MFEIASQVCRQGGNLAWLLPARKQICCFVRYAGYVCYYIRRVGRRSDVENHLSRNQPQIG